MTYSHSQWPLTQAFTKSFSPNPAYHKTEDPNSEPYLSTQFHPKQHLYQLPEASLRPVTPPSAPPAAKRRQWRIFPWSARKLLCWKRWKDGTGRKEGIYRDFWSDVWRMIDTLILVSLIDTRFYCIFWSGSTIKSNYYYRIFVNI